MGNLTPILFRNDCIHLLLEKKLQAQICEKIYSACQHRGETTVGISDPMGGGYSNPIESLGCRHSSEDSVIFVGGNTWIDITRMAYSDVELNETYIQYLEGCLKEIRRDTARLSQRLKDLKK